MPPKKMPLLLDTQLQDQDYPSMISPITEEHSPVAGKSSPFIDGGGGPFFSQSRRKVSRPLPDYLNDEDFEYSGDFSFGAGSKKEDTSRSRSHEEVLDHKQETRSDVEHHSHSHGNHTLGDHSHSHDTHSLHGHSQDSHAHSHGDHGHSHTDHSHTHDDHSHSHDVGHSHSHSEHFHEHSHTEHENESSTNSSPLSNLIVYFFPFLSDGEKTPFTSVADFVHQLYLSKETKSIFRFLVLNFTFMFVQMLYSFRSKSLGLFSDSLHMLLDCSSLAIGLFAKLISKRIVSTFYEDSHAAIDITSVDMQRKAKSNVVASTMFSKYPFGLARIETLAAFVNGILLLLIVQDIFFQSVDRILNPVSLKNINELLVVSILGLLVNLVGIFAFNHGHDEEDDNGHGHSHSLKSLFGGGEHSHSHEDGEGECSHKHLEKKTRKSLSSENDHGIFLHILADTLGSLGVIISTVMLKFFPSFKILDPFSSLFIIALILLSSIPLIKNSFMNLLLVLDQKERFSDDHADAESLIRDLLNDLYESPGVVDITKIKIWKDEKVGLSNSHGHSHSHGHSNTTEVSNDGKTGLIGYVHIIFSDGENSTIIKKRCERIIADQYKLDLFVQLENELWAGKLIG